MSLESQDHTLEGAHPLFVCRPIAWEVDIDTAPRKLRVQITKSQQIIGSGKHMHGLTHDS